MTLNAANNGRLVIVAFVQKWRSHAQKAQAQGCPESAANDVAWPCYSFRSNTAPIAPIPYVMMTFKSPMPIAQLGSIKAY